MGCFRLLIIIVLFLNYSCLSWALDCSPLDPRETVSKETENSLTGSAKTLFKIGKIKGEFTRRAKEETTNIYREHPNYDKLVLRSKLIYLYCTILDDSDLSPSEQRKLLQELILVLDLNTPGQGVAETPEVQAQRTRKMTILFGYSPLNQREGEPVQIRVKVQSDNGKAVPDAYVQLQAEGGTFERSASSFVSGRTDSDGVFFGVWRSQLPGAGKHTAMALVSKQGFSEEKNSVTFSIQKKR